MSNRAIKDYLVKQLFIEKNIVTFRSLSRQFGIHVNVAKDELAVYHKQAPYDSQTCYATYLLTGEVIPEQQVRYSQDSEDVDMEFGATPPVIDDDEEEDDENAEEVPVTKIRIVNENDLEAAKLRYNQLNAVHVYSLSPAPIRDAGLLFAPTDQIRKADNTKGPEFAKIVGRITSTSIKMKVAKQKRSAPDQTSTAGPSKLKAASTMPVLKAAGTPASSDIQIRDQAPIDQGTAEPEKEKATVKPNKSAGRIDFKPKAKEPAKKDELTKPAVDLKKKMFFMSKPTIRPASPAPSVNSEPEKPKRGVKRKSDVHLLSDTEEDDRTSVSTAPQSRASSRAESIKPVTVTLSKTTISNTSNTNLRVKRGVVLSDDEDEVPVPSRRKTEAAAKAKMQEERETRELMEIDDDHVERVVRKESARPTAKQDEEEEEVTTKTSDVEMRPAEDDDVDMIDDTPQKPKPKKKRERKVIPIGSNGLKKKKVTKTKKVQHANGYTVIEDFTDWESANEEDPVTTKSAKTTKAKAKPTIKAESDEEGDILTSVNTNSKPSRANSLSDVNSVPTTTKNKSVHTKPGLKPTKSGGGSKNGQKSLTNFFGPPKTKK